jgi:DNA polymerase-4
VVEQISIDEAFLDLSDIPESGENLAISIQEHIRDQLNLPCSIGVATNKLVAKIATDVGKASKRSVIPPCAINIILPGQEADFLAPLPTTALWGIGPKTAGRLEEIGIHTIGDINRWPRDDLIKRFGKFGADLATRAQGIDDSPIITSHETKSISLEVTFARDVTDINALNETLHKLSEGVGRRLRKENLTGSTIRLKLRWFDFTTITRQKTLVSPTDNDKEIFASSKELLAKVWHSNKPVRLIGVGITPIGKNTRQLSLWEATNKKDHNLLEAVDALHERYGKHTIIRGSELKGIKQPQSGVKNDNKKI